MAAGLFGFSGNLGSVFTGLLLSFINYGIGFLLGFRDYVCCFPVSAVNCVLKYLAASLVSLSNNTGSVSFGLFFGFINDAVSLLVGAVDCILKYLAAGLFSFSTNLVS